MPNNEGNDRVGKAPLRILMAEDLPSDADLSARELGRSGIECEVHVVDTAKDMLRELLSFKPDIVLSDYSMPQFTGIEALEICKKHAPNVPFIIVTASINEETAVECIKRGADDYVTKQHLIALPYAVRNTIERKRLEIAELEARELLEQSARQWRTSFDAMGVAIAIVDPQHKIVRCNRAMRGFIGEPWDRIIGQLYFQLVYGLDEAPAECPVIRASRSLRREIWQTSIGDRIFEVIADPIVDKENRLTGIVHVMNDITESKRAESRLIESRKKLDSIYQSINDGILLADPDTHRFTEANRAICEMLGYAFDQITTLTIEDIHPVEELPRIKAIFESMLRGENSLVTDIPIKRKDGGVFHADINAAPLELGGKRLLLGVFRDITARKKAEESLREQNRFTQTILDNLPVGLAVNSIDTGATSYLNKKFEEIYGWPKEELQNVDQFFEHVYPDPQYREQVKKRIQVDIRSGDPERMIWDNVEVTTKEGESRYVFAKNIPLYEQDLMISTVQDMTESRKLQKKLNEVQKLEAIATLAGGIAHDFNNILSAVIGYAELVKADLPPESNSTNDIKEVLIAGHRAKDLIGHILTFSRQMEHDRVPTAPHLIIKEVLGLLKSTLPASIEVRTDIVKSGMVLIDPTQLHQVIMNLCTNAYHAMRDTGGVLMIKVSKTVLGSKKRSDVPNLAPGEYVCLSVGDTGIGMTADIMARIYDPYFTTKAEGEGTGLGLSTAHGIIKNCQGDITVSSEPGKGSVFRIYLPSISGALDAQAVSADYTLPTGSERILYVDDEPALANLGRQMLERLGYRVVTRTNPLEALKIIRDMPDEFDLLITDMNMPGMSGVELAGEAISVRMDLPIILCTGWDKSVSEDAARTAGIREIVLKPVVRYDLAAAVRRSLDPHEQSCLTRVRIICDSCGNPGKL